MTTIIDSLILKLGLDPSGMKKGQEEVSEGFKKTRESVKKSGDDVEAQGKKMAQSISQVRNQVLSLMAAFLAGRGIKEFVKDTTEANAAVGRLGKTLHQTTEQLSAWRGVATLTGGSADGITGSIQNLVSEFQNFAITGESSVIPWFRALNINIADSEGRMRDVGDILLDLADKFSTMDPAKAAAFGKNLGLDQGTINTLLLSRRAVQELLEEQKRLGVITKEDAEAAIRLQHAMGAMQQSSMSMGRALLTQAAPALEKFFNWLTKVANWMKEHKPFMEAFFYGLAAAAAALAIAMAPISLTTAAVTAAVLGLITVLALLYDDWKTWNEGGKSLFADFWNYMAAKWASIKDVVIPHLQALGNFIMSFFNVIKSSLKFVVALFSGSGEEIKAAWKELYASLGRFFFDWLNGWRRAIPSIAGVLKAVVLSILDWIVGRINAVYSAIFRRNLLDPNMFKEKELLEKPKSKSRGRTVSTNANSLADLIGRGEGDYNSVNLGQAGGNRSSTRDLENMTVAEVMAAQDRREFNAAGRYQLIRKTMREAVKGLGLSGEEKFDKTTQDKLFNYLITTKRPAIGKYLSGESNDLHAALKSAAMEWASVADPDTGRSYYEGVGNNRASISAGEMAAMLKKQRAANLAPHPRAGAGQMATSNDNRRSSNVTSETNIGKIEIKTNATDAQGIAKDLKPAIERNGFATQANYSLI